MKTIANKTRRPLKIKLSQGRVLRLGPFKDGQIATPDADRESIRRMVEAGEIEIIDDASPGAGRGIQGQAGMTQSQGHRRQFSGSSGGDR
jgi:hypothetical protein